MSITVSDNIINVTDHINVTTIYEFTSGSGINVGNFNLKNNIIKNNDTNFGVYINQVLIKDDKITANNLEVAGNIVFTNPTITTIQGIMNWKGNRLVQDYKINDVVYYNNTSYICKLDTVGNALPTNTTYWDILGGSIASTSNIGTSGVGVFKQQNGTTVELKKLTPETNKLAITNNATDNTIMFNLNESNVVLGNLSGGSAVTTHIGDATKHRIINDTTTTLTSLWSSSKITAELALISGSLSTIQLIRTTDYVNTGSFVNVTFDTETIKNAPTILDHDNINPERIYIKRDGIYLISYEAKVQDASVRLYKNNTTLIAGSDKSFNAGSSHRILAAASVIVSLLNNDYITVQATGLLNLYANTVFSVIKLDGLVGPQGPAGLNATLLWRNTWNSALTYVINDVVFFNGSSYVAIANTALTESPTTAPSKWSILAQKGDQGIQGIQGIGDLQWKGTWNSGLPYAIHDTVFFNGSSYTATSATSAGDDPLNFPAKWNVVAEKGQNGIGITILWKNTWSSVATYNLNDAVSLNGSSYISKTSNLNKIPTSNPSDWDILAQRGLDGTVLNWQGNWSSGTAYLINSAISYNGSSYVAIANTNIGEDPILFPSKWNLVASKGGNLNYLTFSSPTLTSTTSTTYVPVNLMTATPIAGTWHVIFSSTSAGSVANQQMEYALFKNGVIIPESNRQTGFVLSNALAATRLNMHTQAIILLTGVDVVDVRMKTAIGQMNVFERNMVLLQLS
jgi:hypothetical protein